VRFLLNWNPERFTTLYIANKSRYNLRFYGVGLVALPPFECGQLQLEELELVNHRLATLINAERACRVAKRRLATSRNRAMRRVNRRCEPA
jgi:hypothetical protein